MSYEMDAVLLEDVKLTLDELATSCHVSREWIVARIQWGLLSDIDFIEVESNAKLFDSRTLVRIKRMIAVERDFEGNPELAGLVADLIEEIESLRARLRCENHHFNQTE